MKKLSIITIFILTLFPAILQAQESDIPTQEFHRWRSSLSSINQLPSAVEQNVAIPVLFGVSLSDLESTFGDPRSGGRTHEGIDIMAPKGTPVVSPTQAVVLSTGVWTGAGNYVSTANPGGESFVYMHLDSIADIERGDVLASGDIIGYVGNTGNAAGGADHLHFEIHDANGVPTDPYPRLTKEFTISEKITFLNKIFAKISDKTSFAQFLVGSFALELLEAKNAQISLPAEIANEMSRFSSGSVTTLSSGLSIGSRGNRVVELQKFLIIQNIGPAAKTLAAASATGYFGSITQKALTEYINATGAVAGSEYETSEAKPLTEDIPAKDLTLGARDSDVVWLQTFLINKDIGSAAQRLARATATGYFGEITRAALAEYQKYAGISPAAGYFGPITRAYISATL